MNKILATTFCLLLITGISLSLAPVPAHAITIFGVRFFEKPTPTPTPKPTPTVTPTPSPTPKPSPTPSPKQTPTPTATATPVVAGNQTTALPHTGPAEDVSVIILGISGGFLARKYLLVSQSH